MRLSVAIITHNEEENLADCLASVAFADEIVVVDNGSTDRTREIARAAGATLVETPDWPGFGRQKNRAIEHCQGEWILSLDADERVSEALRQEVEREIAAPRHSVYAIPRSSLYVGRFMRHGGWAPDYVTRLFRRGSARFNDANVHEALQTSESIGRLVQALIHYTYRDVDTVIDKFNRYSTLSAQALVERGRAPGIGTALLHGLAAFLRSYVLRRGFLDGRYGLMLAISSAEGSYYRYVKAMVLAERRRESGTPQP
jgi:glycosyltransferase involved in cell wall biosynthesis